MGSSKENIPKQMTDYVIKIERFIYETRQRDTNTADD